MPAIEPLSKLIGTNPCHFTKEENLLIEADLFVRICGEIKGIFREKYQNYFGLMRYGKEKENAMLDANFAKLIIQDILSTEEYNLNGITLYTNTFEDVIQEIIEGRNIDPSSNFLRRIIELHRMVRPDLYHAIFKKIASQYSTAA